MGGLVKHFSYYLKTFVKWHSCRPKLSSGSVDVVLLPLDPVRLQVVRLLANQRQLIWLLGKSNLVKPSKHLAQNPTRKKHSLQKLRPKEPKNGVKILATAGRWHPRPDPWARSHNEPGHSVTSNIEYS